MKKIIFFLLIATVVFGQRIRPSEVKGYMLEDSTITADKIATGVITSANVSDSSITSAKIATGTVEALARPVISDSVSNPTWDNVFAANYLWRWRSSLAIDQNSDPDTVGIMILGDSHAEAINNFLIPLARPIVGNAGVGYVSMQNPDGRGLDLNAGPTELEFIYTETDGWTLHNLDANPTLWGIDGYSYATDQTDDSLSWIPQSSYYNRYRIWYAQRSANAGAFTYKIDGVAIDTVDCSGENSVQYVEGTCTLGNSQLRITTETTTDSVVIYGVEFINTAAKGIRSVSLVHGGTYTEQFNDHIDYIQDFVSVTRPRLILISLGANDWGVASKSSAQYYSDLSSLVTSLKSVSDASILLVPAQKQGNVGSLTNNAQINDTLSLYQNKMIQISKEDGIGFWDKFHYLPDWVTATNIGLTAYPVDGVHGSTKGILYISTELAKLLFEGYGALHQYISLDSDRYNIIWGGNAKSDYAGRDTEYSSGIGWNIFGNMTGSNNNGMGRLAGLNMSGDYNNTFGYSSGRGNTGSYSNFFGYQSGFANTGQQVSLFGVNAGYANDGDYTFISGNGAGQYNFGDYLNAIGRGAGQYNTATSCLFEGYNSGQYNTGTYSIAKGYFSGRYNTSPYALLLGGINTGLYNEGANIYIGRNIADTFQDNVSAQKAFTNANVSGQNITITSHGFGSAGAYRLLKYKTGTGTIGGMSNGTIYKFKIVDANTVQSFGFTIGTATAGSDTLTPQSIYTNSIVIGQDVEPSSSNQTTLGNSSITETVVHGTLTLPKGINYAADAVGSDSYAISLSNKITSYTAGMMITFKAGTGNTDAATLNVNSIGAVTIKKMHDQDLTTGDIETNQIVIVIYDGTNFQMISQVAQ